jgi:5'-methylthioadenosine phosphorylase
MLVVLDSSAKPGISGVAVLKTETPFGAIQYQEVDINESVIVIIHQQPGTNPKSLAYAARTLGGTRVLSLIRDSHTRLATTPADFIEFTSGRPTTFFETIGTGYVQQNPPFCPQLRRALLAAGVSETPTLLVVNELPEPAVRAWWQEKDVNLIATTGQPEGALCRELELCFAALALPETIPLRPLLEQIMTHLPAKRTCGCGQLMANARKFGKLTADWFENL